MNGLFGLGALSIHYYYHYSEPATVAERIK